MRNSAIILLLILLCHCNHAYSQNSDTIAEYGSNLEVGEYETIYKTKVYYETYGRGTPLLLLHGGLGTINDFKSCIPALASHFKVIAMDSPGHGRSGYLDSLSYPLLADYVSSFIDRLKLDSVYVLGWSDGGVIGMLLAADRSDKVKKLIAVGANSRLDGIIDEDITWMRNEMIHWAKNEKDWVNRYLSLSSEPVKLDSYLRNTQKMWLTNIYVPETKIKSIRIPTLIVQGDRDLIKIEHSTELYRKINNSQLCILPNTSHFVLHERAELMCDIAIEFFKANNK